MLRDPHYVVKTPGLWAWLCRLWCRLVHHTHQFRFKWEQGGRCRHCLDTQHYHQHFILEPGQVTSATDGDVHYIGVGQMIRLYQLRSGEYVTAGNEITAYSLRRMFPAAIILRPRPDGQYGRPKEK
jgi:hypothetical protein